MCEMMELKTTSTGEEESNREEESHCLRGCGVYIPDDFGFPPEAILTPQYYKPYISRVLLPSGLIEDRINKMALDIWQDYPRDRPLHLLCILKSASVFHFKLAEQLRRLSTLSSTARSPVYFEEFIRVSSYTNKESQTVSISGMSLDALKGKDVLLVEDVVDTGKTLSSLTAALRASGVASAKVATLLVKRTGQKLFTSPDYVGFCIPDEFIVGFGIDYNQHFRDLPPLCVINKAGEAAFSVVEKN
eukprot:Gregarina_sp_Pseudo_9__2670@NODE_2919_length_823_cov_8_853316_g2666_i0_p1_GENE_NODE_2919_length_823_cov_8_853316_g2666_i0NODE_2919_length_823_cov_8_853316_g2666_i0_p1_ORF_typecomplete_len246_score61_16Pribosyltran/PF00156_27/2_8e21Pribosyl_synth/PF14572_6/0_014UPRTase/PF14681_6/0_026PRTase_2/PF15609_6/0_081_NODE_2919_length_823_cov_8_853316_g2666_i025762